MQAVSHEGDEAMNDSSAAWGRFKDDCPECGEYACVCRESEEEARLLNLWVTMPNYVRIVYGFVPPWRPA